MNVGGLILLLLQWGAFMSLPPYVLFVYGSGKGRRMAAAVLYPLLFPLTLYLVGAALYLLGLQGMQNLLLLPFVLSHALLVALAFLARRQKLAA